MNSIIAKDINSRASYVIDLSKFSNYLANFLAINYLNYIPYTIGEMKVKNIIIIA